MTGKASRDKGQRGERAVAKMIHDALGHDTHRGFQARGGSEQPDVVGMPGHHVEVKRTERTNIWSAMRQAEEDCDDLSIPIVFTRKNREPWLVVLHADDYLGIIRECEKSGIIIGTEESRVSEATNES